MGKKVTIGGDKLGSGNKMQVETNNYGRSTHNLDFVKRTSMSAGTLVPFISMLGLPGDDFELDIDARIQTQPTVAPLFGSYKAQFDVFKVPIRLYNAKLHMNLLKVGMDMKNIFLPQMRVVGKKLDFTKNLDNQQINPSCILNYLGIRGIGTQSEDWVGDNVQREFNATNWLMYWDIYKEFYANKQEEVGVVIHNPLEENILEDFNGELIAGGIQADLIWSTERPVPAQQTDMVLTPDAQLTLYFNGLESIDVNDVTLWVGIVRLWPTQGITWWSLKATEMFAYNEVDIAGQTVTFSGLTQEYQNKNAVVGTANINLDNLTDLNNVKPRLQVFPLSGIDDMKLRIMRWPNDSAFTIDNDEELEEPYKYIYGSRAYNGTGRAYSIESSQEGLGVKTYQSDIYNNWLNTEWLDGENGVNAITAIQTDEDGKFTIDQLNLNKKLYDLFNQIAITDGTYDSWLEVSYDHERRKGQESPMYLGGLSKEVVFQEVVSNSGTPDEPLGTLGGRGGFNQKHKGGKVYVKIDEPSYIIGIMSLTPRIDYSQGNEWDTNLKNFGELHVPALDGIGFQELMTDGMAFWDTTIDYQTLAVIKRSAGKQPAWTHLTTNVNKVYGNFAIDTNEMYQVLCRNYEPKFIGNGNEVRIKDLTTYIDPAKFNVIFAQASLDAQNFKMQVAVDCKARRKMSARMMPTV